MRASNTMDLWNSSNVSFQYNSSTICSCSCFYSPPAPVSSSSFSLGSSHSIKMASFNPCIPIRFPGSDRLILEFLWSTLLILKKVSGYSCWFHAVLGVTLITAGAGRAQFQQPYLLFSVKLGAFFTPFSRKPCLFTKTLLWNFLKDHFFFYNLTLKILKMLRVSMATPLFMLGNYGR